VHQRPKNPAEAPTLLFPLTTDRPRRKKPRVIHGLLLVNLLVFLWTEYTKDSGSAAYSEIIDQYAVWTLGFRPQELITSAFLHADLKHIFFNMLVLAALGPNVEDKMGHFGFSLLYLVGAAASAGAHLLVSDAPAIGASGAVATVTGAYLVLFPRTQIICFFLFTLSRIAVPAWWFIGLSIAIDLIANGLGGNTGIAHAAHLGGYGFGIFTTLLLLKVRVLEREPYDLFTYIKQRKRRAEFAAAARVHDQTVERQVGAHKQETPEQRALNEGRIGIGQLVSAGRLDEAADKYRVFVDEFGYDKPGTSLSRDLQLKLAEHLVRGDDRATAVLAYRAFCRAYPTDRETPTSQLMAGLMLIKNLGKPDQAKPMLESALPKLHGEERGLAEELLKEVAGSQTS
jgi:membrane associated rhomboid family serine protease